MNIKERNNKILIMFKDYKTTAEIARKFKITRVRVGQIIYKYLDKDMIDSIKAERKKIKANDRIKKYRDKYKDDKKYRDKIIDRARKRYYKLKDSQKGKIEFHIKSHDYFATTATVLDLVSQKIDDKLSAEVVKQVIRELLYLQDNYRLIKK